MFKPTGDSILVQLDEDATMLAGGLLHKPETAQEHIYAQGVVLAVGPGKWSVKGGKYTPIPLEPGEGIVVIKFLAKTKTGEYVQFALGDNQLVIKPSDVLFAYDRETPIKLSQ